MAIILAWLFFDVLKPCEVKKEDIHRKGKRHGKREESWAPQEFIMNKILVRVAWTNRWALPDGTSYCEKDAWTLRITEKENMEIIATTKSISGDIR